MKVYQVVYEHDGETTTVPGKKSTEINRVVIRYAAEHIAEVWEAIEWLRNDEEQTVIVVFEEHSAISVLGSNVELRGDALLRRPARTEGCAS